MYNEARGSLERMAGNRWNLVRMGRGEVGEDLEMVDVEGGCGNWKIT